MALLIIEHRRNQTRGFEEQELEREEKRNKKIEVQNSKHREEINKLLHKFKTPSEEHEPKTVKLPSLSIPSFDGDPTKWKSYWQQFEATIHNLKKLDGPTAKAVFGMGRTWQSFARICLLCGRNLSSGHFA